MNEKLHQPLSLNDMPRFGGLNIVGCDLVEVSPPYDLSRNTSVLAANLLYEMLCILPGVHYRD